MCYKDIYNIESATLICLIQAHPVLWDSFDDYYKYDLYACEAWYDICTKLNGKYESLSESDQEIYWCSVVNKWREIRKRFRYWLRVEKRDNSNMKEENKYNKYITQFLEDMCDHDCRFSGAEDYDSSSPNSWSDNSYSENEGVNTHQKSLYTTCLDNLSTYSDPKTRQNTSSRTSRKQDPKDEHERNGVDKDLAKARALQKREMAKAKAWLVRERAILDKKMEKAKTAHERAKFLSNRASLDQDHLDLQKIMAFHEWQVRASLDKQRVKAFKDWQDRAHRASLDKQEVKAFNESQVDLEKLRLKAFKEWQDRASLQKQKKKSVKESQTRPSLDKAKCSKGWHERIFDWWDRKLGIPSTIEESSNSSIPRQSESGDLEASQSLYTTCLVDNTVHPGSEQQQNTSFVKDKVKKKHLGRNRRDLLNTIIADDGLECYSEKENTQHLSMSESHFAQTLRYFESKRQDHHTSNLQKTKLMAGKKDRAHISVKKNEKVEKCASLGKKRSKDNSNNAESISDAEQDCTLYTSCIDDTIDYFDVKPSQGNSSRVHTNAAKDYAEHISFDKQVEKTKKLSFSDHISEYDDNSYAENDNDLKNLSLYASCLAETANHFEFKTSEKEKDCAKKDFEDRSLYASCSADTTNYFESDPLLDNEGQISNLQNAASCLADFSKDFESASSQVKEENVQGHTIYDSCMAVTSNCFQSKSPQEKVENNLQDHSLYASTTIAQKTKCFESKSSQENKENNSKGRSFYTSCLVDTTDYFDSKTSLQKKERNLEDRSLYASCMGDTTDYFESKSAQEENEKNIQNRSLYASCLADTSEYSDSKITHVKTSGGKEMAKFNNVLRDDDGGGSRVFDNGDSDTEDHENVYTSCLTNTTPSKFKSETCGAFTIVDKDMKKVEDHSVNGFLDAKSIKTEESNTCGSKDTDIQNQTQYGSSLGETTRYSECGIKRNTSSSFSNNASKSENWQERSSSSKSQQFSTQPLYSTPFKMPGQSRFQLSRLGTPVNENQLYSVSTDQFNSRITKQEKMRLDESIIPPISAKERHVSFFKAILPTLKTLSDDETLLYQQKVLQTIRAIKSSRNDP